MSLSIFDLKSFFVQLTHNLTKRAIIGKKIFSLAMALLTTGKPFIRDLEQYGALGVYAPLERGTRDAIKDVYGPPVIMSCISPLEV